MSEQVTLMKRQIQALIRAAEDGIAACERELVQTAYVRDTTKRLRTANERLTKALP